jgi:hypothetical protein
LAQFSQTKVDATIEANDDSFVCRFQFRTASGSERQMAVSRKQRQKAVGGKSADYSDYAEKELGHDENGTNDQRLGHCLLPSAYCLLLFAAARGYDTGVQGSSNHWSC